MRQECYAAVARPPTLSDPRPLVTYPRNSRVPGRCTAGQHTASSPPCPSPGDTSPCWRHTHEHHSKPVPLSCPAVRNATGTRRHSNTPVACRRTSRCHSNASVDSRFGTLKRDASRLLSKLRQTIHKMAARTLVFCRTFC